MDLGISAKVAPLLAEVRRFMSEEIAPLEPEYLAEIAVGDRWQFTDRQTDIMEGLKDKAQTRGLWNFFLTDGKAGSGLNTVEYAYLAEEMGKSHIAAEVFNCAAPDTGNMEVLHKYGSEAQKKQWLEPLMKGEIRSAYAMTEPGVASSDATNISTNAVLEGDEWVINGEKHYVSGAGDPRCKIMIVMVKTDPQAPKHLQQSQILVPTDTPGFENIRPMNVFSLDDAPHGHMHQRLCGCPGTTSFSAPVAVSRYPRDAWGRAASTIACAPSARRKKPCNCCASAPCRALLSASRWRAWGATWTSSPRPAWISSRPAC